MPVHKKLLPKVISAMAGNSLGPASEPPTTAPDGAARTPLSAAAAVRVRRSVRKVDMHPQTTTRAKTCGAFAKESTVPKVLTCSDISVTVVDMTHSHAYEGAGFGPHAFFMSRKGRGHGPRGGHGFGPFGRELGFGPGGPWGRGGRRRRRGDVRAAILLLLSEEPRNGYGLMKEIEERSEGEWRPSPGSVYPTLSQLEDEGLTRERDDAGRKSYELTVEGRTYVEEHREALGTPWELDDEDGDGKGSMRETKELLGQVIRAAVQVMQVGDERQQDEARKILTDARKSLYRLLAEEDGEDES